ncbi:hypothetical protein [Pseudooceanicola marinus]|uniref:hypothetical protein n=1 Tax=Pseudooceanicola marinus TaxID=396013 RepID=UPI001CD40C1D|nr:hypothetical protein [Pseudooceanicola marinus]MCA1337375.1 hypothetical protein [Pseudooceanicola marinus]
MRDHPPSYDLPAAPELFARCPVAMQSNWAEAKRAQGHPISEERMARLRPGHLTGRTLQHLDIGPRRMTDDQPLREQLAPYMERTRARVAILAPGIMRRAAARRAAFEHDTPPAPDGGDAA